VFEIIDKERRQIVAEFETRDEAEARLAELLEEEPEAEALLIITSTGETT
jgi:hypothetical protein